MRKSLYLVHNYHFYCKMVRDVRHEKSVSWSSIKNTKYPVYTCRILHIFRISRMSRKLSVANFTLHEKYLRTFHSSYYFLEYIFLWENPFDSIILPLLSWNSSKWRHEKSVSRNDHSNANKSLHTFNFSHVFMWRTHFTDFLRVVCNQLYKLCEN